MTPLLLLVFAAAADLGRAFYAYVAVENAAKEGALFGSRTPLCDAPAAGACADPNNVTWHVQAELQNLTLPNGTKPSPVVSCLDSNGVARGQLRDCTEGDVYQVRVTYPFRLLTPILSDIVGNFSIGSTSRATVLNVAFDPTPGLSAQKLVLPTGASNASEIVAKCQEPNDHDAQGYYRSPCLDTSTVDPVDKLSLHFDQGTTIRYKITLENSGSQPLTGITVSDSRGSTGCTFPTTLAAGASATPCTYTRTAPTVVGAADSMDYENTVTADSAQTAATTDAVTVVVDRPPAELQVLKWVSPFKDGADGDGTPSFGTQSSVAIGTSAQVPSPSVWFKVIVRNIGGRDATGLAITDSRGALPFGQNSATAICDAKPTTLAPNAMFQCRYRVTFTTAQTANNTAGATATNVVPDGNDSATATVQVAACTGSNRVVPNLIGMTKAAAQSAWTSAGFTSANLTVWNGQPNSTVVAQTRAAFSCVASNSTMTASKDVTP